MCKIINSTNMADERFLHISKDPRFQAVPTKERKVKIDQRFQSMFKDERFNYKYSLDKRGRPFRSSTTENLRRYYDLSDDTSDESDDEDETLEDTAKVKQTAKKKNKVADHKLKSKKCIPDDSKVLETMKDNNSNDKQKSSLLVESERKMKSCHLKDSSKKDIKEVSDDDDADNGDDDADSGDDDEDDDDDDDDDDDQNESGLGSGQDLARGIGNESSSSDDSDFDSLDENCSAQELGNIVHDWGEMDKDAVLASESSSRLAICNMDWENITAVDLFLVLNSFKPPQGSVLSVKIYPSEYGLKRMEEENVNGPPELAEIVKSESDEDEKNESETEEGNTFHNEKLRQYEINRMKYYYAVLECDSVDTANYLYNELDGTEYEQSRTCFDMRFIPSDMEFTETARDVCTELPSKDQYRPNQFINNAMSSSTVTLSWDETNRHRVELTTQKFSKKQDMIMDDFKAYLASSTDDSENEGLNAIVSDNDDQSGNSESENEEGREMKMNKYKKLLVAAEEHTKKKQDNVEMEIIWEPGLKEKTESLLKKRNKKQDSTPWLDYLDKVKAKRKEKKSTRKAAKKEASEEKTIFSDDDMPADVDLNDPYFSSELTPNTNKKSKTQKKKEKKKKKLAEDSTENLTEQEIELKKREKEELALLMADDDDDDGERKKNKHHFDFEDYIEGRKGDKKKKSKKKLKQQKSKQDDFKIDLNDKRFEAVFTSGHYNIDKSAPDYKKSAGMEELIEEKLWRRYKERTQTTTKRKNSSDISGSSEKYSNTNATNSFSTEEQSIDSLVRSIKSKMSNLHNSKKMKIKHS